MSRAERRYFKLYTSRHVLGGHSNYQLLFDAIAAMDTYDEAALLLKFKKHAFTKRFPITKRRLYEAILRSLDAFHAESSVDARLHRMLHHVELLYHRALYTDAQKILTSVRKLARSHDRQSVLLEVLDESGRQCAPGEPGRVVVTPLHNLAMPLLRYEIGDYAVRGQTCACGRELPVLARIAGRRRNMLRLPDGSSHWPSFAATVWLPYPCIHKIQLAQTALDSVEVRVESTRDLDAGERERLFATLAERLGWPMRFSLRRVARIGRDDDYKFEDFVSLLEGGG